MIFCSSCQLESGLNKSNRYHVQTYVFAYLTPYISCNVHDNATLNIKLFPLYNFRIFYLLHYEMSDIYVVRNEFYIGVLSVSYKMLCLNLFENLETKCSVCPS